MVTCARKNCFSLTCLRAYDERGVHERPTSYTLYGLNEHNFVFIGTNVLIICFFFNLLCLSPNECENVFINMG